MFNGWNKSRSLAAIPNLCYTVVMAHYCSPVTDLIERAAATSLDSARVIARSIATVMRSIEVCDRVARTQRIGRTAKPVAATGNEQVQALPLTPPRLLELADEFNVRANKGATPESRTEFQDLMFRYMALAAGYDSERTGNRMLH